ncbi:MAG: 2-oxoglutarate dehydrogenase E1 component, partial [Acidobacteriota bacterium]|nr:2-oxoglutarate dehydrogenase E1 component [Acidobacteriota bacterium]
DAFSRSQYLTVMPDRHVEEAAERILMCTGKIGHALRAERERRGDTRTAILSIEQLYPFPKQALAAELDRLSQARDLRWVQEEPGNMGALFFVEPHIEPLARGRHLRTIKRSASASPATGSAKAHQMEENTLIKLAYN